MKRKATPSMIIGTRTSKLALWQTEHIQQRLQAAWPELICASKPFLTTGDKTLDRPLPEIGGKGLFTSELERALLQGEIDIAVHSLKDLPIEASAGLTLGAITSRGDVRDGLIAREGWTLASLPEGAIVGTSSLRRQAQLLAKRPDLRIKPIRGNVDTRVRKVLAGEYDAAVLAAAGLERLGLAHLVTQWLDLQDMLPAPGQAALAVQCRATDETTLGLLSAIDDLEVRTAVNAERAFLSELGGGCSAPVAAHAIAKGTVVQMRGCVARPDGQQIIYVTGSSTDAWALGARLARDAMAQGAGELLATMSASSRPQLGSEPLRGKRIVVTRSGAQAASLSDKLTALGATAIEIPMIRIDSMPDKGPILEAIRSIKAYDWVMFTSVNGVEMFWQIAVANQLHEKLLAESPLVAAVGPATTAALVQRGIQPAFTPDEFVSEAMIPGLGDLNGKRILLPRADIGRKNLTKALVAQGAIVNDLPVYRTLPTSPSEVRLDELKSGVDVVLFTSGSSARNWARTVDADARSYLVACIGPVTAEVAREVNLIPDIVATTYSTDGLVEALVAYFQGREPTNFKTEEECSVEND